MCRTTKKTMTEITRKISSMSELKRKISTMTEKSQKKTCVGVRHFQFFIFFIGLLIFYGQRTALSVAIIAMTDENPPNSNIPTYPEWDNTDIMLSSFFWGYILPQPIAGQLGEHFGPKWFLVGTMITGSVINALIPVMAGALGPTGVIVCRLCQGLNQGFIFPSYQILISKWAPFSERTRVLSMIHSGSQLGIVVSMIFSGTISGSQIGWPYVFYIFSAAGILYAVIFGIFVANSPAEHKSISEDEKMYIESNNLATNDQKKKVPTPWKAILTSTPVWAIFITFCAQAWGTFTLLTEIPSFLSSVMGFDIHSNGEISALPYVVQFLVNCLASPIPDKIIANDILSVTNARKVFNAIGTLVPGCALFALGFVDGTQRDTAIILLIVAVAASALSNCGSLVNGIDLSPNHSGTILGLTNGFSQIFSVLGPMSVGFLGSDKTDLILWRKVFWLAAGIYWACGVFFVVFSTGKLQSWNDAEDLGKENKESVKEEA